MLLPLGVIYFPFFHIFKFDFQEEEIPYVQIIYLGFDGKVIWVINISNYTSMGAVGGIYMKSVTAV